MTEPRGESGLDFRLLAGPEALGYEPDLAVLHGEIYADPPYSGTY